MGYYTTAKGYVQLKQRDNGAKVLEELRSCYEINDYDFTYICFGFYSNYYEDEVEAVLNAILPYISDGEVEYVGEDDCYWRFILKNGKWKYQSGHIVYDDEDDECDEDDEYDEDDE